MSYYGSDFLNADSKKQIEILQEQFNFICHAGELNGFFRNTFDVPNITVEDPKCSEVDHLTVAMELDHSPAGEDLGEYFYDLPIELSAKEMLNKFVKELFNEASNFDCDEHVEMMKDANGAPDLEELVEDAAAIENNYFELGKAFKKSVEKYDFYLNEIEKKYLHPEEQNIFDDLDEFQIDDLTTLIESDFDLVHIDECADDSLREKVDYFLRSTYCFDSVKSKSAYFTLLDCLDNTEQENKKIAYNNYNCSSLLGAAVSYYHDHPDQVNKDFLDSVSYTGLMNTGFKELVKENFCENIETVKYNSIVQQLETESLNFRIDLVKSLPEGKTLSQYLSDFVKKYDLNFVPKEMMEDLHYEVGQKNIREKVLTNSEEQGKSL